MLQRSIPSSGEMLPVIGIGTWKCFDVPDNSRYPELRSVLKTMHETGGTLIDTSPMYGMAEKVIGDLTEGMTESDDFFYATKVWTTGRREGIAQMESSLRKMKRESIGLMQIHNLTDWKTHLPVLRDWKAEKKIKYIGITHYTDAMHDDLEKVLSNERDIDFVQFNYSIDSRHAEKRLLKAAADHGVATIINRPFGEGKLFQKVGGKPLPAWAAEAGATSWSSFFLRFILSHPAVTCVIPATSNAAHAVDNFSASNEALPDELMRLRMAAYIQQL
jgi:diketogulonate reductase-like aldo/keto reductase